MNAEPLRLLLLEDNPSDAVLAQEYLSDDRRHRYEIVHCASLEEALSCARENPVRAALLDLFVPDSQGLDTLRTFKQEFPDAAVLVLTGLDDEDMAVEAVELGAQDYVLKSSLSSEVLARSLRHAVARKALERRLWASEESYRQLFRHSLDGVARTAPDGSIFEVNQAFAEMLGYTLDELQGVRLRREDFLDSNDPRVMAAVRERTRSGRFRGEMNFVRKDGTVFPVELTTNIYLDEDGRERTSMIVRDVSEQRANEQRLKDYRDQLARSERMSLVMVTHTDLEGRWLVVPPRFCELLGYSERELLGMSYQDLTHPDDLEHSVAVDKRIFSGAESSLEIEKRYVCKDGHTVWVYLNSTVITDQDGNPLYFRKFVRDITERVEEERQRKLLESAVVNARDAVVITDTDLGPDGPRILYANPAFTEMTGYTPDDIIGRTPRMLQGVGTDLNELARLREALRAGEPVSTELLNYTKDGKEYLVELNITPMHDNRGKLSNFVSVQRDVTERREQERRMFRFQEFRTRLAALADEALGGSLKPSFFNKVLEYAIDVVPGAEAGSLMVKNDEENFQYVAVRGFDVSLLSHSLPVSEAFPPVTSRQPVVRFGYEPRGTAAAPETVAVLFSDGVRSDDITESINVPVWIDDELRAILNLDIFGSSGTFTADDLEMGKLFGRQVGTILQRLDLEQVLREQASTDPLTGLPNRKRGEELLASALELAHEQGSVGALCLLDVDNFKAINDAYGHALGDALMREIGRRLALATSSFGTLARWAGDEFMVICPNAESTETLSERAAEVIASLEQEFKIGNRSVAVGSSMGVVVIPTDAVSFDAAIDNAHIALREAKHAGNNAFALYQPGLRDAMERHTRIREALRSAVRSNLIHLHYQPRIDLRNDRVTSVEALARWTDEQLGQVSPGEFIPVAEETDLIHDLGAFVLDEACRQAKAWLDAGTPRVVAVNLSLKQLLRGTLTQSVRESLERHQLRSQWLELEITESAAMENVDKTIAVLRELHELGINLAIDDFGTAYSSLAHLKLMPIDALKIDRSFVMGLHDDPSEGAAEASIVQAVIALGKSMNLKVIAEGVETENQKKFLKLLGCDEAQGYLFSRPVPPGELRD